MGKTITDRPAENIVISARRSGVVFDDTSKKNILTSILTYATHSAPTHRLKRPGVIHIAKTEHKNGTWSIRLWVDLKLAPEGRAYEFGSGLHRERGRRRSPNQLPSGKIAIFPKKPKKYLAFAWDVDPSRLRATARGKIRKEIRKMDAAASAGKAYMPSAPKFAGVDGDRVLMRWVAHPGVEPKAAPATTKFSPTGKGYLRGALERGKYETAALFKNYAGYAAINTIKVSFAKTFRLGNAFSAKMSASDVVNLDVPSRGKGRPKIVGRIFG